MIGNVYILLTYTSCKVLVLKSIVIVNILFNWLNISIKWYLWIKEFQLNYNSILYWLIKGHLKLDDWTINIYNAETQTQEGKRLKDNWKKTDINI